MEWKLRIFFARATRGLRRPSLDARTMGSASPPSWECVGGRADTRGQKGGWKLMVSCARRAPTINGGRPMRAVKDRLAIFLR